MTRPILYLKGIFEVSDIRDIIVDQRWLRSCICAHRLKPGEGVLYTGKRHDSFRCVAKLGVPTLLLYSLDAIDALCDCTAIAMADIVRLTLTERRWSLCTKLHK